LVADYPEYETLLRKYVIKVYGHEDKMHGRKKADPKIQFLKETIKRVPYLANIDDACFFDIMFALKSTSYEKD